MLKRPPALGGGVVAVMARFPCVEFFQELVGYGTVRRHLLLEAPPILVDAMHCPPAFSVPLSVGRHVSALRLRGGPEACSVAGSTICCFPTATAWRVRELLQRPPPPTLHAELLTVAEGRLRARLHPGRSPLGVFDLGTTAPTPAPVNLISRLPLRAPRAAEFTFALAVNLSSVNSFALLQPSRAILLSLAQGAEVVARLKADLGFRAVADVARFY
jgi:hypothetical protein